MTREEQIDKMARAYATIIIDTNEVNFYGKDIKKCDFVRDEYEAFKEGAEWADNNPVSLEKKDTFWISANDDLPCNHPEMISPVWNINLTDQVLVYTTNGINLDNMQQRENSWFWVDLEENDEVLYWAKIPTLEK